MFSFQAEEQKAIIVPYYEDKRKRWLAGASHSDGEFTEAEVKEA